MVISVRRVLQWSRQETTKSQNKVILLKQSGVRKKVRRKRKKKKTKKKTKMIEVKMPDRESIWAIIKMFGFRITLIKVPSVKTYKTKYSTCILYAKLKFENIFGLEI